MWSVRCVCMYVCISVCMYVCLKMFDSHKLTEMKAVLCNASSFGMARQIPSPKGNLWRLPNVFERVKSALWDQTNLSLDTDAADKLKYWGQRRI